MRSSATAVSLRLTHKHPTPGLQYQDIMDETRQLPNDKGHKVKGADDGKVAHCRTILRGDVAICQAVPSLWPKAHCD